MMHGIFTVDESLWIVPAPELPDTLAAILPPGKPVIDLGCGMGYYLWTLAALHGREVYGVDGTEGGLRYLPTLQADLAEPLALDLPKGHVISTEVGEHIPAEFESVYLDNVVKYLDGTLVLSWAVPGQGGMGHVNERTNDYVIREMQRRGCRLDIELTMQARGHAFLHTPWFYHSLMVFRKSAMDIGRAEEIAGWMHNVDLAWLAEQAKTHNAIVEIGSYMGRSTRALGDHTAGVVAAIDNWRGPAGDPNDGIVRTRVYERFCENLGDLIAAGKVLPLTQEHASAAVDFAPDMVFIDGSHDYESVKRDIEMWKPRLVRGGLLCGHDITNKPVERAVRETLGEYKTTAPGIIWYAEIKGEE